jgi:enolase
VSEARGQTYAELYRKLDMKEGENDVYKMAKFQEKKIRDFNQVKCIKDEADRLLVKDDEIKNKWKEYFDKLFNDNSEKITIELDDLVDTNRRFVRRIQKSEVKKALKI